MGHHDPMAVRIGVEGTIEKIHAQQSQLPKLIGDVLADIGDGAIGADNDLVLLVPRIAGRGRGRGLAPRAGVCGSHDPAPLVPSLGLVVDCPGLFQEVEGVTPEIEVEDVALLGKEVVGNANATHGGQMTPDNGSGNVAGDVGGFSLACLDFPKGSAPQLAVLGNSVIERGDLGVEIPAVVVELAGEAPDFLQVLFFQIHEADHHVGDLDAGIVDIILDFHPLADRPEQASKGVAQDGVAQVSDVGGLVGVDIGVLENDLSRTGKGGSFPGWLQQSPENVIPLQEAIEVAGARPPPLWRRPEDRGGPARFRQRSDAAPF